MYKIGAFITFGCWALLIAGVSGRNRLAPARPSLDYEFFKTKVQPIFSTSAPGTPGASRVIGRHAAAPAGARPGRHDVDRGRVAQELRRRPAEVVPGSVKKQAAHASARGIGGRRLLHNGGKHFSSQNDPEWQTLKAWVMGQTAKSSIDQ